MRRWVLPVALALLLHALLFSLWQAPKPQLRRPHFSLWVTLARPEIAAPKTMHNQVEVFHDQRTATPSLPQATPPALTANAPLPARALASAEVDIDPPTANQPLAWPHQPTTSAPPSRHPFIEQQWIDQLGHQLASRIATLQFAFQGQLPRLSCRVVLQAGAAEQLDCTDPADARWLAQFFTPHLLPQPPSALAGQQYTIVLDWQTPGSFQISTSPASALAETE
ncbi:hypothetical protein HNQ59_003240 [Chitinivorax tropicus]|uniref:Uncharacterized protein n=1 Tax=Chitinivorax tropicus TaxID=714531 RepID=A0A840MT29_9PROT|nr:hypothetical protein [Chitinivorax tropicus]MBB5019932.1 hypothetical protein [Chitinivorax tropicus]